MTTAARRIEDQDRQAPDFIGEPLDPRLLAALEESDEQIARGELVPGDAVMAKLDALFGKRCSFDTASRGERSPKSS